MNAFLALALALPLIGAVVIAVGGPRARWVGVASASAAAATWTLVAGATDPPTLGRVVAVPLVAATVAGTALLVATSLARTTLAASASLCGITVLAAAASTGGGDVPDRPLAAGILVLVLATVGYLRTRGASLVTLVAVASAAVALAGGTAADDLDRGAAIAVVGAAIVLAAVIWHPSTIVVVPAVALTVARTVAAATSRTATDGDAAAWVAAGAAGRGCRHRPRRVGAAGTNHDRAPADGRPRRRPRRHRARRPGSRRPAGGGSAARRRRSRGGGVASSGRARRHRSGPGRHRRGLRAGEPAGACRRRGGDSRTGGHRAPGRRAFLARAPPRSLGSGRLARGAGRRIRRRPGLGLERRRPGRVPLHDGDGRVGGAHHHGGDRRLPRRRAHQIDGSGR